jgi:hypothetical protein
LSSQARWGKPPADGRTNSPAVRRLFAHAQNSFSMKLPQTVSANHVRLPCHACFTSNGAGSGRVRVRGGCRRPHPALG